jgi:hypothetical protein
MLLAVHYLDRRHGELQWPGALQVEEAVAHHGRVKLGVEEQRWMGETPGTVRDVHAWEVLVGMFQTMLRCAAGGVRAQWQMWGARALLQAVALG